MRVTDAYTNRKVVTNWEISADDIRRALNLPADKDFGGVFLKRRKG